MTALHCNDQAFPKCRLLDLRKESIAFYAPPSTLASSQHTVYIQYTRCSKTHTGVIGQLARYLHYLAV